MKVLKKKLAETENIKKFWESSWGKKLQNQVAGGAVQHFSILLGLGDLGILSSLSSLSPWSSRSLLFPLGDGSKFWIFLRSFSQMKENIYIYIYIEFLKAI